MDILNMGKSSKIYKNNHMTSATPFWGVNTTVIIYLSYHTYILYTPQMCHYWILIKETSPRGVGFAW